MWLDAHETSPQSHDCCACRCVAFREMMSFAMGVYFRASPRMKLRLMTETFKKEGFSVIRSLLKL